MTYLLRYFFDFNGSCLWAANDAARERFGYPVEEKDLPISENLKRQMNDLCRRFDTSLDWDNPAGPSPWSKEEAARFQEESTKLLEWLRKELGPEFEIRDERDDPSMLESVRKGSIAVFTWKGRDLSEDEVGADAATRYSEDYGEQWEYQAGYIVTISIMEKIQRMGYAIDHGPPYFMKHAWHFGIQFDKEYFSVAVRSVPSKNEENNFAIDLMLEKSFLTSLLFRQKAKSAILSARDKVNRILNAHPLVEDVKWVDKID